MEIYRPACTVRQAHVSRVTIFRTRLKKCHPERSEGSPVHKLRDSSVANTVPSERHAVFEMASGKRLLFYRKVSYGRQSQTTIC